MRIISKHKDYYDYLVGIYGMDPIMVYDRRTSDLIKPSEDVGNKVNGPTVTTHKLAICNNIYTVFQFENKFYHTIEEIMELNMILDEANIDKYFLMERYLWRYEKYSIRKIAELKFEECNYKSEVNRKTRQPVLIETRDGEFQTIQDGEESTWSIPELALFGFARWYKAEIMYQDISAFIGWLKDHPEIPDKMTDKEKIQSHGFDNKISFRHRK